VLARPGVPAHVRLGQTARLEPSRPACSPIAGSVRAQPRRPGAPVHARPGQAVRDEAPQRAEGSSGGAPVAVLPPEGRPGLQGLAESYQPRGIP
jgi:hypothetical protein